MEKLPTIWNHKPIFEMITAALLLIVALDMGTNGRAIFLGIGNEFGYTTLENYQTFIAATQPLTDSIKEEDSDLYRINQSFQFSKNDAMILGYNGMTHYSSTYNQAVNDFSVNVGMAQAWIWNSGYGATPLIDSLLSVKYILEDYPVPDFYSPLQTTELGTASYRNTLALPLVYSAPATHLSPDLSNVNPFVNQNALLNSIAGTELNYFSELAFETTNNEIGWTYTFTAESDNPVYLYMNSGEFTGTDVFVNDVFVGNYFSTETNCCLYLGSFAAGEQVTVKVVPLSNITVNLASISQLHMDLLSGTLSTLQDNGIQLKSYNNANLQGTISVSDNQTIITSIPYDEAWSVKIDGEEVETSKFADTFLAINTTAGEHNISFSYVSPGFITGLHIGLITVIFTILYFRFQKSTK